jgi:DNA-binding protein H-NS
VTHYFSKAKGSILETVNHDRMGIVVMAQSNGNANTQDNGSIDALSALAKLSVQDIEQLLRNKKQEQARVAAERGKEARKDVEDYIAKKWGLTLAQVWMAGDNYQGPKTYLNPANKETYTYSGRGKVPAWLKDEHGKPNQAYLVKSN